MPPTFCHSIIVACQETEASNTTRIEGEGMLVPWTTWKFLSNWWLSSTQGAHEECQICQDHGAAIIPSHF